MTLGQLREALSEFPDDAIIDIWVPGSCYRDGHESRLDDYHVMVVETGPNKGTWITLYSED